MTRRLREPEPDRPAPLRAHLQRRPALRGGEGVPRRGLLRGLGGRRGAAGAPERPRPRLFRAGREGGARRDRGQARRGDLEGGLPQGPAAARRLRAEAGRRRPDPLPRRPRLLRAERPPAALRARGRPRLHPRPARTAPAGDAGGPHRRRPARSQPRPAVARAAALDRADHLARQRRLSRLPLRPRRERLRLPGALRPRRHAGAGGRARGGVGAAGARRAWGSTPPC